VNFGKEGGRGSSCHFRIIGKTMEETNRSEAVCRRDDGVRPILGIDESVDLLNGAGRYYP